MGVEDSWRWKGLNGNKFTVKGAYAEIEKRRNEANREHNLATSVGGLWKTLAPFKAQIMAWRLLLDRLPTRDNLLKRNMIISSMASCNCCNAEMETAENLFLACSESRKLWNQMTDWVGVAWAAPKQVGAHREAFSNLLGRGKLKRKLGGLWTCVVWVLWKWRNAVLFEGLEWDFRRVENEIKCRFWSWCVVKGEANPCTSFINWASNKLFVTWDV